jgi:hypothetical protein
MKGMARFLVSVGMALVIGGLIWHFFGDKLPIGKLPGDFVIRRPGYTVMLPLGTCVALSVLLTAVSALLRWIAGR